MNNDITLNTYSVRFTVKALYNKRLHFPNEKIFPPTNPQINDITNININNYLKKKKNIYVSRYWNDKMWHARSIVDCRIFMWTLKRFRQISCVAKTQRLLQITDYRCLFLWHCTVKRRRFSPLSIFSFLGRSSFLAGALLLLQQTADVYYSCFSKHISWHHDGVRMKI